MTTTSALDASLPKKTPQVDLDRTRERLIRLGLVHAADRLGEHVATAAKETHPPHRFLDALLEAEVAARDERRVRTSLKLSGLPSGHTLSNFDFAFQPSVERSRIETLATCAWIREKESLLIQGPPGVGKTHLAVALGVRAIENGFSVAFHRLEDLLAARKRDADVSPQRLRQRKHMNVALLIIDEVGFEPMNRSEASLFFRLVSYRYGRGSILITTNKGVAEWPAMLAGDEVLATAILDRLLHHSQVLNISGRSHRLRDLERAAAGSNARTRRDRGPGAPPLNPGRAFRNRGRCAKVDVLLVRKRSCPWTVGKTKRGKGTKIMAITDGAGLPFAACISSASPAEATLVEKTLDSGFLDVEPERMIGDKAYESDELDERLLWERRIEMIAPHRSNRK